MDTTQFSRLRERANYLLSQRPELSPEEKSSVTQAHVAEALRVTVRTVASWERADRELSRAEANMIRDFFLAPVLRGSLQHMCNCAFDAIHSEVVALWVVQERSCILLPYAKRYHDFAQPFALKACREVDMAEARLPLVAKSLTAYPLRSGEAVREAGDAIARHPSKHHGGRSAFYTAGGLLESLMHVPAFTPSPNGPQPVLLLSLQNKLDAHGDLIKPKDGCLEIYDARDEGLARKLAAEFRDEILEDLRLLDIIV